MNSPADGDPRPLSGECFCGAVAYRISAPLQNARCCHCSRCRKAFSGAASAYAELSAPSSFSWLRGEELVQRYMSQQQWGLGFCRVCGTSLCGYFEEQVHGVTLGPLEGDPGVVIRAHIFVGSKAPWDDIGGSAPQFDKWQDKA